MRMSLTNSFTSVVKAAAKLVTDQSHVHFSNGFSQVGKKVPLLRRSEKTGKRSIHQTKCNLQYVALKGKITGSMCQPSQSECLGEGAQVPLNNADVELTPTPETQPSRWSNLQEAIPEAPYPTLAPLQEALLLIDLRRWHDCSAGIFQCPLQSLPPPT